MSIGRKTDMVKLDLSKGFKEVLESALEFNNYINRDRPAMLSRNEMLKTDLKYVQPDGTLASFKSRIPAYIYMLIENYIVLGYED